MKSQNCTICPFFIFYILTLRHPSKWRLNSSFIFPTSPHSRDDKSAHWVSTTINFLPSLPSYGEEGNGNDDDWWVYWEIDGVHLVIFFHCQIPDPGGTTPGFMFKWLKVKVKYVELRKYKGLGRKQRKQNAQVEKFRVQIESP